MLVEIILFVAVMLFIHHLTKRPAGMPPGPWGLPIIGKVPPRGCLLNKHIQAIGEKYDKIFSTKIGSRIFVMLKDYKLIKEAFSKAELQGRPQYYTYLMFNNFRNVGVIFAEGNVWTSNRQFSLRHLRDLGLGKSRMEDTIQLEAKTLIDDLKKELDHPFQLDWNLNVAVLNVIWSLVANRRHNINDPEIKKFVSMISNIVEVTAGCMELLDFFPILVDIIPDNIKNKWMGIDKVSHYNTVLKGYMLSVIRRHKVTLDKENPRDLIDMYLIKMEEEEDLDSTLRTDLYDLTILVEDLFVAGSETTSSTLRWIFLYMALHPEIQDKVQREIDEAVPRDRLPSLEEKDKLHYFNATLMEIQRVATLVPMGLLHAATEDTTLLGYRIPKGTSIVACIEHCHKHESYWDNPEEFRPQRFLDSSGEVITKRDGFLPFSVGRRQCLGESLAKMELFLFASAILQKFTISAPEGETLSTRSDPSKRLLSLPLPFKVILRERK